MDRSKFSPGQIVATPGCLAAMAAAGQTPHEFLVRHISGDWGVVNTEDAECNDTALLDGSRLFSVYSLRTGTTIWIITEAADESDERTSTCLLLPEEY
ncbi:hypothetical protein R5W24_003342 [Gemmata sp. JC717]|uniref:hypothetical protein n=1 Tax=Gemmata algarum TaxID=2975278 RepID=UPI0021BAD841|nr:hypothetical protein [Gemmata algarum]MDY3554223.1 hypothetical protein [Gemmata algarum]